MSEEDWSRLERQREYVIERRERAKAKRKKQSELKSKHQLALT